MSNIYSSNKTIKNKMLQKIIQNHLKFNTWRYSLFKLCCICFQIFPMHQFTSVQFSCSVVSNSLLPHESQHSRPPYPSPTPDFTQTHVHRVGDAIRHLILCRPLFLLPPIPPSMRVFSNASNLRMRWPKYWSLSL